MATRTGPPLSIATRRRLAVVAGGTLGAAARFGVAEAAIAAGIVALWATLAVNVADSLALGFVAARHIGRARSTPLMIPFVGIGMLGAFTTFSLVCAEVIEIMRDGSWFAVVAHPVGSIAGGSSVLHTSHVLRLSEDLPMVIEAIDARGKVYSVVPRIEEMIGDGLTTLEPVEIRVLRHDR